MEHTKAGLENLEKLATETEENVNVKDLIADLEVFLEECRSDTVQVNDKNKTEILANALRYIYAEELFFKLNSLTYDRINDAYILSDSVINMANRLIELNIGGK